MWEKTLYIYSKQDYYQTEQTGTPFDYASASYETYDHQWYSGHHQHVPSKIISASME